MHAKTFNILSHKGNTNQSYIENPSHPIQNGYHKGNKQQQILMRKGAGKEPLHTVGGNVS
jgi:hypothetical protein